MDSTAFDSTAFVDSKGDLQEVFMDSTGNFRARETAKGTRMVCLDEGKPCQNCYVCNQRCFNCLTICKKHLLYVPLTWEKFRDTAVWQESTPYVETYDEFLKYDAIFAEQHELIRKNLEENGLCDEPDEYYCGECWYEQEYE